MFPPATLNRESPIHDVKLDRREVKYIVMADIEVITLSQAVETIKTAILHS